ncbi:MAG: AlbA family DNA-binding domain-containing protein [Nitrososphaeraceae archaeon]
MIIREGELIANTNRPLFLSEVSFSEEQSSKSIYDLLNENESKYLEFKSSMIHLTQKTNSHQEAESIKTKMQKEIFLTISAFSNTKGGTIIVGVDDRGKVLGIEDDYNELSKKKDWDGWQQKFRDLFWKYFDDKLLIQNIELNRYIIDDKTIVRIDVPKSSGPVYINKNGNGNETEFYIRTFTSSEKLDGKFIYGFISSKDEWKK